MEKPIVKTVITLKSCVGLVLFIKGSGFFSPGKAWGGYKSLTACGVQQKENCHGK